MRIIPLLLLVSSLTFGQNLLVNPGFETPGLAGWNTFGPIVNDMGAAQNGTGGMLIGGDSMAGGFSVFGAFQEFPAAPGDRFLMDGAAQNDAVSPITGAGVPNDTWVVFKIAFFDAGNNEIGSGENIALDGNSAPGVWIDVPATEATAPAGTVKVQALILYLQPNTATAGFCSFDDMVLELVVPPTTGNLLANKDFEAGLASWTAFGNAFPEANNPVVPARSGNGTAKLFGNFSGGFDVTGIFQSFPAAPGETYTLDGWARHFSGDALTGNGPPSFNWVVFKIAFFDAGGVEIAGAETIALDGTSPTDFWLEADTVEGTAPAGTTSVQALVLFLQPNNDGGAAFIDDMRFQKKFDIAASQNASTGAVTIDIVNGEPNQILGRIFSLDPRNGTMPDMGPYFDFWIDFGVLDTQIFFVATGSPIFGGVLDANGNNTLTLPGIIFAPLSGQDIYFKALTADTSGVMPEIVVSPTAALTLQ